MCLRGRKPYDLSDKERQVAEPSDSDELIMRMQADARAEKAARRCAALKAAERQNPELSKSARKRMVAAAEADARRRDEEQARSWGKALGIL